MEKASLKVAADLYLVRTQYVAKDATKKVEAQPPTHHIIVDDCSGSMGADLPRIREQLKSRIPKMLREGDTLSIIWFSGRGQFGTLFKGEPVATLVDLKEVHNAIDRYLKPIGLTGFKEPLEEVGRVVAQLKGKSNSSVFSLCFMSDGCDNQWRPEEILKAAAEAGAAVQSTTFVEYGYYADRARLAAMAEKAGGSLIFAEDFDRYGPVLEQVITKKIRASKRVSYSVEGDPIGGFVFAMGEGELLTFAIENGKVALPEEITETFYLAPEAVAKKKAAGGVEGYEGAIYAAMSLFATRMKPGVVWPLLKETGDVAFIDQFANCFGKQKYTAFQDETRAAAFEATLRLQKGQDKNRVPKDDAFTLLALLKLISEDEDNKVVLDHPDWKYSRIGRGREDAEGVQSLKFEANAFEKIAGYSVDNLVWNETRPNVSIQVRRTGQVLLGTGSGAPSSLPTTLETFTTRNYAIVKDGLVNVDKLAVRLTAKTAKDLASAMGALPAADDKGITIIDLKPLPILNRQMVKDVSAERFFKTQYLLSKAQAASKVYKAYLKDLYPGTVTDRVVSFEATYGADAAKWLDDHGVRAYGFSPTHQKTTAARDYYMGKELKASLKGLSSLPSLEEIRKRLASKKPLTISATLMKIAIDEVEAAKSNLSPEKMKTWLEGQAKSAKALVRGLLFEVAQTTFAIVVGQSWFTEFSSLDENTWKLSVPDAPGGTIECKVEQVEIQIEI